MGEKVIMFNFRVTICLIFLLNNIIGCSLFSKETEGSNTAPVLSLEIADSKDYISPGGKRKILAIASDLESKNLTFNWATTGGSITTPDNSEVEWIAPQEAGIYKINCKVYDEGRNYDEKDISITVVNKENNQPPEIVLSNNTGKVKAGENITFSANANDREGDTLFYQWISTGGNLSSADSNKTIWTAPSDAGNYAISCIVTDSASKEAIKTIDVVVYVKRTDIASLNGKRILAGHPEQEYYLYIPDNFTGEELWPLFIGVHAYQSNGSAALSIWQKYASSDKFVLVCPSFPDGYQWLEHDTDKRMIDIINEVKSFNVMNNKIFIAGFSAGAQFAHRFAIYNPENITGVASMSAGGYDSPTMKGNKIKFFVSVGESDIDPPSRLDKAKWFYSKLIEYGYEAQIKIYPGIGHQFTSQTENDAMNFYRWAMK